MTAINLIKLQRRMIEDKSSETMQVDPRLQKLQQLYDKVIADYVLL